MASARLTFKPAYFAIACALFLYVGEATANATDANSSGVTMRLADDALLKQFIAEALDHRPELARAKALLRAREFATDGADAFPDPTLSLGIQNDSFTDIKIGEEETSWISIALSQSLPWFGKRGLRTQIAAAQAQGAESIVERIRLTLIADVERAYLELLLVRDQLALQTKLEALWAQAEELTKVRYEGGQAAQSDLLRAQLERTRLRQRRVRWVAQERTQVATLNRLRGRELDQAIATSATLMSLADPILPAMDEAQKESEKRSPELAGLNTISHSAAYGVAMAEKNYFPDPTIMFGVMPRGDLDPMWQLGLSFSLPTWAWTKQTPAVKEQREEVQAAEHGSDAIRQLLKQRTAERLFALQASNEINQMYRSALLIQSDATVASAMAQYRVGRVEFVTVLEALAGYVADVDGFLKSVAAAQRIAIALAEVSLGSSGLELSDSTSGTMGTPSDLSQRDNTSRTQESGTTTSGGM